MIRGFDRVIQSWDTANKPSELSDYSVCTTWGLKGPNFYLLDVLRKKLSYPELKRAVIDQDARFSPQAILIEDRASGTQLIQELIAAGCSRATRYSPEGDKVMRLHAQTATIENGFVFCPKRPPGSPTTSPSSWPSRQGATTTRSNSTAQALAWGKQRPVEPGIIGYWRRLAEVGEAGATFSPGRRWRDPRT